MVNFKIISNQLLIPNQINLVIFRKNFIHLLFTLISYFTGLIFNLNLILNLYFRLILNNNFDFIQLIVYFTIIFVITIQTLYYHSKSIFTIILYLLYNLFNFPITQI